MANGGNPVARGGAKPNTFAANPVFKIHPAIGVARVGDAKEFFLGPEEVGKGAVGADSGVGSAVPPFRAGGKIKRQGQRYRIFYYPPGKKEPEEITLDHPDVVRIRWTVHLENQKANFFKFDGQTGAAGPYSAPPPARNAGVSGPDRVKNLVINPEPRSIAGRKQGPVKFKPTGRAGETWPKFKAGHPDAGKPVIDYLGELHTDDKGRLVVLGGHGVAKSSVSPPAPLTEYANNDNWFDDVSDGPVTATVKLKSTGKNVVAKGAWAVVGPPDFAPPVDNIITLYDTIYDVVARNSSIPIPAEMIYDRVPLKRLKDLRGNPATYQPEFDPEIKPLLTRTVSQKWVHDPASIFHNFDFSKFGDPAKHPLERERIFNFLRPFGGNTQFTPPANMPKLFGDEYGVAGSKKQALALTETQYKFMEKWKDGKFKKHGVTAVAMSPEGLDKAALEHCVGGAFFPGIEVSWLIRTPGIYEEPFRIKLGVKVGPVKVVPGFFSRQMALPWHADFLACTRDDTTLGTHYGWWPAQRPDDVHKDDAAAAAQTMVAWDRGITDFADMVNKWKTRGFVLESPAKPGTFIEQEKVP